MSEHTITEQFVISPFGEPYLHSINRNAFKRTKSEHTYTKTFGEQLFIKEFIYIIVGTDSGLFIKHITDREFEENARYVFIELPHIIEQIRAKYPLDEYSNNILLCTPDEWQERAKKDFGMEIYCYKNKTLLIKSLGALDCYYTDYHQLSFEVRTQFDAIRFHSAARMGTQIFAKRAMENAFENIYPAIRLKNAFKGQTCILLGGGPSLDENLAWVKENRDKLTVIAVSRIAKKLIDFDLMPDIICTVDPHMLSFDVSKEIFHLPDNIVYMHTSSAVPALVGQWPGKNIFVNDRLPWRCSLTEENVLPAAPTVIHTAFNAAMTMGFKRVLFTGVDLCFAKDGSSHASGSNEAKIGKNYTFNGTWVETYDGGIAEAPTDLAFGIECIAQQAERAEKLGIEMINLSGNAAKVNLMKHIPQEQLTLEELSESPQQIIHRIIPDYNREEFNRENQKVLDEISLYQKSLVEIRELAEQGLAANTALFTLNENGEHDFSQKLKMDEIEETLDDKYRDSAEFLKKFGIREFISFIQPENSDEWSDEKVEESGRIYYQAIIDVSKKLGEELNNIEQKLTDRFEEYKESPDVERLLNRWQEDELPNRAAIWKKRNPEIFDQLSPELQERFEQLAQQFDDMVANENTEHVKLTKERTGLDRVNRKTVRLFQQRNVDALTQFANNMRELAQSDDEAKVPAQIAQAYLLSLQGKNKESLDQFCQIPESALEEDEYMQMGSLALNQKEYALAEHCLAILATDSIKFKPQYALILKLNNKIELALDTYTEYLQSYANDYFTWIALGQLYLSINAKESAKMALTVALQQDPNNVKAKQLLALC